MCIGTRTLPEFSTRFSCLTAVSRLIQLSGIFTYAKSPTPKGEAFCCLAPAEALAGGQSFCKRTQMTDLHHAIHTAHSTHAARH
jgi:hypothetical protein